MREHRIITGLRQALAAELEAAHPKPGTVLTEDSVNPDTVEMVADLIEKHTYVMSKHNRDMARVAGHNACATEIIRALSRPSLEPPASDVAGWRPIAEHDGSLMPSVIVCAPVFNGLGTTDVVGEARFKGQDDGWWWENTDSEYGDEIFPTHWQPLPLPPQPSKEPAPHEREREPAALSVLRI